MTERWAAYKDRPNLRRALMLASERNAASASVDRDVTGPEHLILLGKRLAVGHNSWARAISNALRNAGIPHELTWVNHNAVTRILRVRVLEGEEARTDTMRRLMRRHEFAAADERPAIEAQMVALDAEMEGRTP